MSSLFAPDGCAIPNIRTKEYLLVFAPPCEHKKIRDSTIIIRAESEPSARRYATTHFKMLGTLTRIETL